MSDKAPVGPNVRALIIERATQLTFERSDAGAGEFGRAAGIAVRLQDGGFKQDWEDASAWVKDALAAVRAAPNNPFTTDEEIAGAILADLDKRRAELRRKKS